MQSVSTAQEAHHRLARLAKDQYGAFGTRQIGGLGVTDDQLRHLARRGLIERLAPQVFLMAGVPPSWRTDLSTGLLSLGPTAVVSHEAAAKLHGFDRFGRDVVEFTVRRRRRGAFFLDARIHTSLILPARDIVNVDGLRVTHPVRTIIDLAALRIRDVRLEAAVDSAIRLQLASIDEIVRRLGQLRGKGRAGVRRLDRVLVTSGGHTMLERAFLEIVHDFGLPAPTPQVVHRRNGRHIARVDFLFADHDIVVEVSGGRGHSSAADRARDARRRNQLQQMGRLVLEFTFEDVIERPGYVLRTMREAFGTRSTAA